MIFIRSNKIINKNTMTSISGYGKIIEEVSPKLYAVLLPKGIVFTINKHIYSIGKIDDHDNPVFSPDDPVFISIKTNKDIESEKNIIEYKGVKYSNNQIYEYLHTNNISVV